jgi:hypothetical protein
MDKFVRCPPEALVWEQRRWRLLEEHKDVAIAYLLSSKIKNKNKNSAGKGLGRPVV